MNSTTGTNEERTGEFKTGRTYKENGARRATENTAGSACYQNNSYWRFLAKRQGAILLANPIPRPAQGWAQAWPVTVAITAQAAMPWVRAGRKRPP
ncbi:MAG: hypothetical protein L6Q63_16170, partial [Giesbergeria sp.]|nr:hypothetical protein [Giesbergeria sp.]